MRQAKHFTAQMGQEDEGVQTFYTGLSLQGIHQDLQVATLIQNGICHNIVMSFILCTDKHLTYGLGSFNSQKYFPQLGANGSHGQEACQ